jgi:hypothetical protein
LEYIASGHMWNRMSFSFYLDIYNVSSCYSSWQSYLYGWIVIFEYFGNVDFTSIKTFEGHIDIRYIRWILRIEQISINPQAAFPWRIGKLWAYTIDLWHVHLSDELEVSSIESLSRRKFTVCNIYRAVHGLNGKRTILNLRSKELNSFGSDRLDLSYFTADF